ncbi:MAG: hypothetical protein AB7F75_07510 [Planctomycetota bacterium]
MKRPLLALLVLLSACSVWSRSPSMWMDIRPLWEDRIATRVHGDHFGGTPEAKVTCFVMPDGETPEVRILVSARLSGSDASARNALSEKVELVVRDVMRYASDVPSFDTSRIVIQLSAYAGDRQVWEYKNRSWAELPGTTDDSQLLAEAHALQMSLAKQHKLE